MGVVMQLVSFNDFVVGALRGQDVVDLSAAIGDPARLPRDERLPAVAAGFPQVRGAIDRAVRDGPGVPLATVRLRAPNPRPPKLLCAIGNYGPPLPSDSPLDVDFTFKS